MQTSSILPGATSPSKVPAPLSSGYGTYKKTARARSWPCRRKSIKPFKLFPLRLGHLGRRHPPRCPYIFSLLLSRLELSDTNVYEPSIRARTAAERSGSRLKGLRTCTGRARIWPCPLSHHALSRTFASPVVSHPSTGHAYGCSASEIRRDPAFPTKCDRTTPEPWMRWSTVNRPLQGSTFQKSRALSQRPAPSSSLACCHA